jgi:hypothetical protein
MPTDISFGGISPGQQAYLQREHPPDTLLPQLCFVGRSGVSVGTRSEDLRAIWESGFPPRPPEADPASNPLTKGGYPAKRLDR